ncbi:hypothetical protein BJX61DRAFT_513601 [Aspergillus egyptiacus]|nr:hypothetical protein BJX61DRAFT_513601 [Aspergillus egyptiacus]
MRALLAITALFSVSVLAQSCSYGGYDSCEWYGDAPFCGSSGSKIGQISGGMVLVDWTKDGNRGDYCDREKKPEIQGDCCDTYGLSCVAGYKRLWCNL